MSARKRTNQRKASKVKLIEVAGHLLTPELHDRYLRCLQDKQRRSDGAVSHERIVHTALDAVTYTYRFSHASKDELLVPLYSELTALAFAMMALRDYPFYNRDSRDLRSVGCDALDRLAAVAQRAGSKLHMIAEAIRHEADEKLQDWQRRRAAYDAAQSEAGDGD